MSINRYFKLFLNAGAASPLVINVNQYDKDEVWHFTLFSETGEQYYPNAAAIVGKKSDGNLIANAATVDGRGYAIVTETEQMTAAPGVNRFELLIDGQIHGTANFIVLVEPSPTEGGVVSDSDLSLIQQAMDSISPSVIAQSVSDWMSDNLTPTTPPVDASLTVSGAAADAKKTGDEINDLKSEIAQSTGMSTEFKVALENLLNQVIFKGDDPTGRTYLNALHTAMYPPANLTSISAVYTQSGAVYDTDSLDDLKADLVVTAYYDNGTSEIISTYTLSGTLAEGTSTITVAYGGETTTFDVTVSSNVIKTVTNSDMVPGVNQNYYRGKGYGGYTDTGSKQRFSYPYFDIAVRTGETYQFTVDWVDTYDLYLAIAIYDENVLDEVDAQESITTALDSGWKRLEDVNGVVTVTATTDSVMRFTFKNSSTGTTLFNSTDTYINSVTIRKM